MKRWLNKHWLYAIAGGIGLILTPAAIHSAYIQRGYFAIGGEYLVLPLALLLATVVDETMKTIHEIKAVMNVFTTSTKDEDMSMDPVDNGIKKDA